MDGVSPFFSAHTVSLGSKNSPNAKGAAASPSGAFCLIQELLQRRDTRFRHHLILGTRTARAADRTNDLAPLQDEVAAA